MFNELFKEHNKKQMIEHSRKMWDWIYNEVRDNFDEFFNEEDRQNPTKYSEITTFFDLRHAYLSKHDYSKITMPNKDYFCYFINRYNQDRCKNNACNKYGIATPKQNCQCDCYNSLNTSMDLTISYMVKHQRLDKEDILLCCRYMANIRSYT